MLDTRYILEEEQQNFLTDWMGIVRETEESRMTQKLLAWVTKRMELT